MMSASAQNLDRLEDNVYDEAAEIYLGLEGEGCLPMRTREGDVQALKMEKGTIAYVSPDWAHRTVNKGRSRIKEGDIICLFPPYRRGGMASLL